MEALKKREERGSKSLESEAPISTLAAEIVAAAVRPEVSIGDLSSLAEKDPAFTIRVLSLVNSPAFALARPVKELKHAAGLIGIRGLRNVALSLTLSDMAPLGPAGELLLGVCLRRAMAARLIAQKTGQAQVEEFFTAGLLLEVGLLARARTDLDAAAEHARVPAVSRAVRERAAGFEPHPQLGADLARKWGLSRDVATCIASHHDATPPPDSLSHITWAAERVAAVYEGGEFGHIRSCALEALATLALRGEEAESILKDLPDAVLETARGFQRSVGPQVSLDALLRDANASLIELNRNYQDVVRELERLVSEKERLARELQEANDRLASLAATDGLTGLANQRAFQDSLRRDLARCDRMAVPLSLVLIDLDHFKRVNDQHGHLGGDEVLRSVGNLLVRQLRTGDVAARYGGEEFAVILPNTGRDAGKLVADRLRSAIEAMDVRSGGTRIPVTASFGVCCVTGPGCAGFAESLVRRADEALYEAKRTGRNRVVLAP